MMLEQWRTVEQYPNYEVSNRGEVRNKKTGVVRKPSVKKSGHEQMVLCEAGVRCTVKVHRFVLTAFEGDCPDGMECRHLDGNRGNNHIENLRWGTHKENIRDSIKHGTRFDNRGEAHGRSKLTEKDVLEIRRRAPFTERVVLAKMFNVTKENIRHIVYRQSWGHL